MHEVKAYEILLEATTAVAHHSEVFGKHSDWHNGYFLSVLEKA